jgi:hypothetical protein
MLSYGSYFLFLVFHFLSFNKKIEINLKLKYKDIIINEPATSEHNGQ